jgi:nitronate monooxygenase
MNSANRSLCNLLGITLPLIQAPMAGCQDSRLAIAVCGAGGLGSLPAAMLTPEALGRELSAIPASTDRPYNVNFFCHKTPRIDLDREAQWRALLSPYLEEYGIVLPQSAGAGARAPFSAAAADALEPFKPAVVSFHFGLPGADLLTRVKSWGSKLLSSATTVDEAVWLEAHGVDAVIAQGFEAGGHRGMFLSDDIATQVGTFALLPQVLKAVRVPVIAAGGIADAAGVAAAMSLGAAGVQVGTSYLLCPESTTSAVHRAALLRNASNHTALTNLFSGRPARGIINRIMTELGAINRAAPEFPLAAVALAPLRKKAESLGKADFSPMWCGQNPSGCKEISAAAMTHALVERLS